MDFFSVVVTFSFCRLNHAVIAYEFGESPPIIQSHLEEEPPVLNEEI